MPLPPPRATLPSWLERYGELDRGGWGFCCGYFLFLRGEFTAKQSIGYSLPITCSLHGLILHSSPLSPTPFFPLLVPRLSSLEFPSHTRRGRHRLRSTTVLPGLSSSSSRLPTPRPTTLCGSAPSRPASRCWSRSCLRSVTRDSFSPSRLPALAPASSVRPGPLR